MHACTSVMEIEFVCSMSQKSYLKICSFVHEINIYKVVIKRIFHDLKMTLEVPTRQTMKLWEIHNLIFTNVSNCENFIP